MLVLRTDQIAGGEGVSQLDKVFAIAGRRRLLGAAMCVPVLAAIGLSLGAARAPRDSVQLAAAGPKNLLPNAWSTQPRPYVPVSRINYAQFDDRMARLASGSDMVGMAVAVIDNGEIAFLKGYGTTTATGAEQVGVRTVFRWASLSKGVAATMVGALAAEGRLSLTDPIDRYSRTLKLPGAAETRASVADVLSHRLGLVRNAYDDKLEQGYDPRVIRTQLANLKPFCPASQCHTYQNVAFDAVTEVVERVSSKSYAREVEERLFAPLGMNDASVDRAGLVGAASWARPHVGRTTVVVSENYYRVPAAGGVNSSIIDLARWMQAQIGARPKVIAPALLAEIQRPRVLTDRRRSAFGQAMGTSQYALGWRDYNYHGNKLVGHQGAVRGYRSAILFDPQRKTGIAVMWNSQSGRPMGAQLELFDMLYGVPGRDWIKVDAVMSPSAQTAAGFSAPDASF